MENGERGQPFEKRRVIRRRGARLEIVRGNLSRDSRASSCAFALLKALRSVLNRVSQRFAKAEFREDRERARASERAS